MILLIDSGNSRLKWAVFQDGKLENSHILNNQELTINKLIDTWGNLPTPKQLALACVSSIKMLN